MLDKSELEEIAKRLREQLDDHNTWQTKPAHTIARPRNMPYSLYREKMDRLHTIELQLRRRARQ